MVDVLVIGGGVAGLEAALTLKQAGRSVCVLEGSERLGGAVDTRHISGFRCEVGASTLRSDGVILNERCQEFSIPLTPIGRGASRRKGVLTESGLTHLSGPGDVLRGSLLSWRAKSRLMLEPLKRSSTNSDESLHEFLVRRLGREAGEMLAPLMARGVYAANSKELSARTAFPRLWSMDRNKGLFRSMAKQSRAGIASLPKGLGHLATGYAAALGSKIVCQQRVERLEYTENSWRVQTDNGSYSAEHLVLAVPAQVAGKLLGSVDPILSQLIASIRCSELTNVQLGYHGIEAPPGFGFLVHPRAGGETLGCVYASQVNAKCAPTGSALLSCMVGPSRDPVASARATLTQALDWSGEPDMVHVTPYPDGIPLYDLKQDRLRQEIETQLKGVPYLQLAGNYLRGISVESSLQSGRRAAELTLKSSTARQVA